AAREITMFKKDLEGILCVPPNFAGGTRVRAGAISWLWAACGRPRTSLTRMPADVMAVKTTAGLVLRDDAAFPRLICHAGFGRSGGQTRLWSGRAPVQNVQIGMVERKLSRLLNGGLREHRSCCHR